MKQKNSTKTTKLQGFKKSATIVNHKIESYKKSKAIPSYEWSDAIEYFLTEDIFASERKREMSDAMKNLPGKEFKLPQALKTAA